jgi:hypothetical protein
MTMPEAGSQQIPECRKRDRCNECFEEWYPGEDEITRDDEGYPTRDDPYSYQCSNDRTNDAQGESPCEHEENKQNVSETDR